MSRSSRGHRLKRKSKRQSNPELEKLVLFVAIVEPLTTLPQILQVYVSRNTGSSMLTWAMYMIGSMVWLAYGIRTRNIPIIISDLLWVAADALVVIGLLVVR